LICYYFVSLVFFR